MPIGTILALASLAGSAYGMAQSSRANRNIDQAMKARQAELDQWYNNEMGTNYWDTEEAKSAMRSLMTQYDKQSKAIDQSGVVSGASPEKSVAMKGKQVENFSEFMNRLAGMGFQRKDMIGREYRGRQDNVNDMMMSNLFRKDQNWSNLGSNAMNLAGITNMAGGMGAFDAWDNKLNNWFAGFRKPAAEVPGQYFGNSIINARM